MFKANTCKLESLIPVSHDRTAAIPQRMVSYANPPACVQAVALGAAVQAGIYEGIVGNAGVVDVWQAALGRALAQQHLQDDDEEYSDEDSDLD